MSNSGTVAVFGTFDGLHKGHRAVLNSALAFSEFEPIAITFDVPPKRFVSNDFVPMLMTSDRKKMMFAKLGFKTVEVLDFEKIREMSAEEFLNEMFKKFNIKVAVCGFNYRFGKNAEGNAEYLTSYCHSHGAEAVVCPGTLFSGQIVSSTFIRNLISDGQIAFANTLLESRFSFCTEVMHGEERGRTLGFPTINQELDSDLVVPKFGVYATSVNVDGVKYPAVTNIGVRPTFLLKKPISETYIIGFDGDLYGKKLEVELIDYIRGEMRFTSADQFKLTLSTDCEKALKLFGDI
jgi:riboflavin kinase/FMN adenylyltransferase